MTRRACSSHATAEAERRSVGAFRLASVLVREGVDEGETVVRLRAIPGGRAALQEAARYVGAYLQDGYPVTRIRRLLLAAAGDATHAPTAEEAAVEDQQRQLSNQPLSVTFQQLAEQVPALRDLERRARTDPESFLRELSPFEHLLGRRGAHARQFRITLGMKKAVGRLVGPSAGLSDPVLSSRSALISMNKYLWEVAGIDPWSWSPSTD